MILLNRRNEISVLIGFVCGFFLCYAILRFTGHSDYYNHLSGSNLAPPDSVQKRLIAASDENHEGHDHSMNFTSEDHTHDHEDNTVADVMANSIRILCMVLTTKKYHQTRAVHVKQTWGKRCTKLIFASDADDPQLGAVAIAEKSSYDTVWGKIKAVFKYAYAHHLNDFDWFLKCDDDTYVVMENFRLAVSAFSPEDPLLMGRRFKPFTPQGYMSGGAGYVLSRKAVEKFVTEALRTPRVCKINDDTGAEDAEMGKCLYGVGVTVADSRDTEGRQRFFPFTPESHLTENYYSGHWIWPYDYYPLQLGPACCSDTAATFHYITPNEMYTLEYTIYHLKPFGVSVSHDGDTVKNMLAKNGYKVLEKSDSKPIHAVHWPAADSLPSNKPPPPIEASKLVNEKQRRSISKRRLSSISIGKNWKLES